MNVSVVRIGNSRGIRIPRSVIERCRIADTVDLRVRDSLIILKPVRRKPRAGWAEAARRAHEAGDDRLLIPDAFDEDVEA